MIVVSRPAAQSGGSVDAFEAVRTLALRLAELSQAHRGGFAIAAVEAAGRPGWIVECTVPKARLLEPSRREASRERLELRVKSDVGALELAGWSLSVPRPSGWRGPSAVHRVLGSERDLLRAQAAAPEQGLAELRRFLAREIEDRIRGDLGELASRGTPFDLGTGWGEIVVAVDPTIGGEPPADRSAGSRLLPIRDDWFRSKEMKKR